MTIIVEIKQVYGNKTIYPVCEQAKLLCKLSGNKTLTTKSINLIKQLGYEIEVKKEKL